MPELTTEVTERDYQEYLEGLLAGDRGRCASIAQGLRDAGAGVVDLYINLFQRALYEVGSLWEQHRISVAVEHMATAITERLLTMFHGQVFSGPLRKRSVIVACAAGEHHQLGGRMVADLFEMHGWRGDFLGANTPPEDLLSIVDDRKPATLALSVTLDHSLPAMLRALDAVTAAHPKLPILVGGQAFRDAGADAVKHYPSVTCIQSIMELEKFLAAHDPR